MLQQSIKPSGKYSVIGGKEINRYKIKGIKGFIDSSELITKKAKINKNSILVQRIVAHLTKPHEHIQITACIPQSQDFVIVDTINQITIIDKNYSQNYIWALLNSKLVNWFAYLFIYGKAIRTMQFDNPVTSRIPIPQLSPEQQRPFEVFVDEILALRKEEQTYKVSENLIGFKTADLEAKIDALVYELYGLTEEEIAVVENKPIRFPKTL